MQSTKLRQSFLFSVVCLLILGATVWAQSDDKPASREISSLDFQAQRPKGDSVKAEVGIKSTKTAVVTNPKRRYALVKRIPPKKATVTVSIKTNNGKNGGNSVKIPAKVEIKTEEIGVTFWRLRPIIASDGDVPTIAVKINEKFQNWTAERVNSTTQFRKGDRVRFTIESSRTGYLYIVNREFYTDGTSGDAELIYPTLRTRGGDNSVVAGSLVDIPGSSYFNVNPRKPNYAGEELLIIISSVKLPVEIGLRAQALARDQIEKWLDDWQMTVDIYDAKDGEGVVYTKTEAAVVNSQSRALTQEEPLPQTIYRVRATPNQPLLVPLRMQAQTP